MTTPANTPTRAVGDMKHGLGGARPQLSILPRAGLTHGGRAIEYGADKYARGNYHGPPPAKLGVDAEPKRLLGYIDATMRHLTDVSDAINRALGTGGDIRAACRIVDSEASGGFPASGLPHLAHAIASLLIGVSCAVDDGLLPADPGQPWRAGKGEPAIAQKDDPGAEKTRVEQLNVERRTFVDRRALEALNDGRIPGPMPRNAVERVVDESATTNPVIVGEHDQERP